MSKYLFRYLVYNLHDSTVQTDTLPKNSQFIVDLQQGAYSHDGQNWTPIQRRPRTARTLITAALLLFSVLAFAQPPTQPYFQHPQRFVLAGEPSMFVCPDVSARPWASISTNGIILHVNAAGEHYQYPLSMADVVYDIDDGLMTYIYETTDSRLKIVFNRDGSVVAATFAGGETRERPNLLFMLENPMP